MTRLAPALPEPYVDQQGLARALGVSVSTVKRWRRQGMPSHTWTFSRERRYRVSECLDWLTEQEASRLSEADRTSAHRPKE